MSHYYLYHEGQAKIGPNKIHSLSLVYVINYVPEIVKELCIAPDICPGQNRNHTLVIFLTILAANENSTVSFNTFLLVESMIGTWT
jgi:hypothetical protein